MNDESDMRGRRRKQLVALGFAFLLCVVSLTSLIAGSLGNSLAPGQTSRPRPELVPQTGHSRGVNCATFAPDNSWLASGGADNAIKIWQVATGRELRTLIGHSRYIKSLATSPNGQWLASGSNDLTVKIWNVATGRELYTLAGHTASVDALAISPDNRWLASGSADQRIKIWELTTGNEIKTLSAHKGLVTALTFSGDGRFLASGSSDTTIKLWETGAWKDVRTFRKHSAKITALTFDSGNNALASTSSDGTVCLWSIRSNRVRFSMGHRPLGVLAVAFGSDGSLISARSDGGVEFWDLATGKEKRTVSGDANAEQLIFAVFSANATTLAASAGNRTVALRDVTTGERGRTLESHSTGFNALAFSRDGRWFAAATNDSSIRLWEVATGRELPRLSGHVGYVTTVSFSQDSRFLASGSRSGEIKVWDMTTGHLAFYLPTSPNGVNLVAFSPNGRFLAAAGMQQTVDIWDLETKRTRTLTGHSEEITSVVFTPDGGLLVSAGRDKTIRVWDLTTGSVARTLDNLGAEINSLALSPDGDLLAAANVDKTVRLWELATGVLIRTLTGHTGEALSVAFSPDGQLLASASSDRSLKVWDPQSGSELHSLIGPSEAINGAVFSNDGHWIISASDDGSMMVWSSATGKLMATLVSLPDSDDWLVATPEGLFDGSPGSWNLLLWRFGGDTFSVLPVEAYFNEFYYPGVLADILAGKDPKAAQDISQKDRRQPRITLTFKGEDERVVPTRFVTLNLELVEASPDKEHASGSGGRDLRLFRNGLLIRTWPGDVLKGTGKQTLETTIPVVAGENQLSAYAFNSDNVKSADAGLLLRGADSLKRMGTAYVLAIGVEHYENSEYDLRYPVADAGELSAQLRQQQEQLGRYKPIVTIPLLDGRANKANILLALSRLAGTSVGSLPENAPPWFSTIKPAQPEDAVVIYFSGHGMADKDRFYLVPHDLGYKGSRARLDKEGLETIQAHSISDVELEEALKPLDADQLLLMIDACKSGQALEAEEARRGPMNTRGLAQLAYEKGMYVLTASQSDEVAFESNKLKHSYLAFALVEEGIKLGAADIDRDGQILLQEWFAYATQRVPQIRREQYNRVKELVEEDFDEQQVQRPRVFYTREGGAERMVIARAAKARNH